MSRPTVLTCDETICPIVRRFRLRLHETQQQFAIRLNTSVRTVARYETVRAPHGAVLRQLEALARDTGLLEFATAFEEQLQAELSMRIIPKNDSITEEDTLP